MIGKLEKLAKKGGGNMWKGQGAFFIINSHA